ncbi:hypothetical protein Vadar_026765 [Vaccinium darrowii]|uniref:Uncharacterized protein n=1 Tax=Vaccinium darrowii TaxID=229202 RepID=A0ACB7Y2F1_9ERIC|nr:hypothetical protein Vadar_026765 [Vaccinium darrowii]
MKGFALDDPIFYNICLGYISFHGCFQQKTLEFVTMIKSPSGAVAAEAKRAQAAWVLLDRLLKHEQKRCMEELQCNIVVMKRSHKVLRHHRDPLEWSGRQKIAVGTAWGLWYPHEECNGGCIVYLDMKPINILITDDLNYWSATLASLTNEPELAIISFGGTTTGRKSSSHHFNS